MVTVKRKRQLEEEEDDHKRQRVDPDEIMGVQKDEGHISNKKSIKNLNFLFPIFKFSNRENDGPPFQFNSKREKIP